MNQEPFVIDNRFCIEPAQNHFGDAMTGENMRLEPRIMAVLCCLARRLGELVTREELVTAIWNDYGGGDEALSQVVSFLRKILDDRDKKLIRTIPKKGYLLSAAITTSVVTQSERKSLFSRQQLNTFSRVAAILYVMITAVYFVHTSLSGNEADSVKHQYMAVSLPKPVATTHPQFQAEKIAANQTVQQLVRFAVTHTRPARSTEPPIINDNIMHMEAQPVQNVDEADNNEGPQARPQPQSNPDPIVRTHIHVHSRLHIHTLIHTVIDSVREIKVVTKVKLNLAS